MLQIGEKLWVNEDKIIYKRRSTCGTYEEITCNPNANVNRYNNPDDGWVAIYQIIPKFSN